MPRVLASQHSRNAPDFFTRLMALALTAGILMLAGTSWAIPVPRDLADQIAQDWSYLHGYHLMQAGWTPTADKSEPMVRYIGELKDDAGQTVAYQYRFPTGGDVVIVNDDALAPVFFYSETSPFDPKANPEAAYLFNTLVGNVGCARGGGNQVPHVAWQQVMSDAGTQRSAGVSATGIVQGTVGPLLTSRWTQDDPYWRQCPSDNGSRCVTGCVATSLAQIMRYWRYPDKGQGSISYVTATLGIPVSVPDFSTPPFDWSNMPDVATPGSSAAQIAAVAQLSFYCGAAVHMDYTPTGSGANAILYARDALVNNFFYPDQAELVFRDQNMTSWSQMMQDQINRGQPVNYYGTDPTYTSAHAFVLDGVRTDASGTMYHFNLGWAGQCDGWYNIDTSGGTCILYPNQTYAIINIGVGKKLTTNVSPGIDAGAILTTPMATSFTTNSVVTIQAAPNWGYVFDHWEGDLTGTQNPDNLTMDQDKTVTAVFRTGCSIHFKSQGSGSLETTPAGNGFDKGTVVAVQAVPEPGWVFDHWEGSLTGTSNPGNLLMDGDKILIASFVKGNSLTVIQAGEGNVVCDPTGVTFKAGSRVTLAAVPATGWQFHKWWGDVDSVDNPVVVTMDSAKVVQAEFIKLDAVSFPLAISTVGQGTVYPFGGSFLNGSSVTLTATPAAGWTFLRWQGDIDPITNANPLVITMNKVKGLTAVFTTGTSPSASSVVAGTVMQNGAVRVDTSPAETATAKSSSAEFKPENLVNSCTLFSTVLMLAVFGGFVLLKQDK